MVTPRRHSNSQYFFLGISVQGKSEALAREIRPDHNIGNYGTTVNDKYAVSPLTSPANHVTLKMGCTVYSPYQRRQKKCFKCEEAF